MQAANNTGALLRSKRWRHIEKLVDVVPFLAFFVVLFFTEYALFGIADALLGIVFLFFSRTIVSEPGLSFANYLRRLAWFFVMSMIATLAGLHPVSMVVVSMLFLLVITILHSDDYLPRNFFWLGMGYLMLLIYPVGPDDIGSRIAATLLSMALATLFIYAMRAIRVKTGKLDVLARDRGYVRRAFDEVGGQLSDLAKLAAAGAASAAQDAVDAPTRADAERIAEALHPKRTFRIAQEYAELEYGTVFRQGGLLSGRQCYTFALLLCCEQLADMAHASAKNVRRIDEDERRYFEDLADVFFDYGRDKVSSVRQMAERLRGFLATHELDIVCHEESWSGVLETMLRTLEDVRLSRDNSTPLLKSIRYRARFMKDNIGLKHAQTRFALQLALIVGFGMVVDLLLTRFAGTAFGIWIPITAFAIMNTYADETMKATLNTTAGTLIGIGVFSILVQVLPDAIFMPVIVIGGYLIVLMNFHQIASVAAVTQMAMMALHSSTALMASATSRFTLVVIGVSCAMAVIFVFMNTRRSTTIRTKVAEIERIDLRLAENIHQGIEHGQVNLWRTVQLLYYLHMSAGLMAKLAASLTKEGERTRRARRRAEENRSLLEDVERVLQANYQFAMDAEHAVMLLDPRRVQSASADGRSARPDTTARIEHIDATVERLENKLNRLERMGYLEDEK
ncbi:FUSC family protein [Enteroscipio rubneri]|uniref:Integral membrane bound transporter domain-containing protein n=1 Tax=Enteroscipio rubneri TaxID=2070686 RepID=A0A2K2UEQ3_9ACTN|nr:FUSC family protein [Enteroscipio rubneri]PNV68815.1 hypothetical protein C2L71_02265 [Enteroscipio rubneri]